MPDRSLAVGRRVLLPTLLVLAAPLGAQESLSDLETTPSNSRSALPPAFEVDRIREAARITAEGF